MSGTEPLRRAAIRPILDALVPTELAAMIAALPEAALRARLYVAFAAAPPVTLTDLVPPERPPQWPKIKPNDRGLSRLVYRDKVDYIRRVSRDVFIGATHRNDEATGKLFVLWREGP